MSGQTLQRQLQPRFCPTWSQLGGSEGLQPLGVLKFSSERGCVEVVTEARLRKKNQTQLDPGREEGQRVASTHRGPPRYLSFFSFCSRHCEEGARSLILLRPVLFPASDCRPDIVQLQSDSGLGGQSHAAGRPSSPPSA